MLLTNNFYRWNESRDCYNNVYFTSYWVPSLTKFWFISTFFSLVETVDRQTSKATLNFWSWKMKTTIIVKVYQDATNTADYSIDHRWTRKYFCSHINQDVELIFIPQSLAENPGLDEFYKSLDVQPIIACFPHWWDNHSLSYQPNCELKLKANKRISLDFTFSGWRQYYLHQRWARLPGIFARPFKDSPVSFSFLIRITT